MIAIHKGFQNVYPLYILISTFGCIVLKIDKREQVWLMLYI